MNIVALGAVLIALGMVAIARYVRHSKAAEANGSVTALAEAAAAYFDQSDFNQPRGSEAESARAMRHFPPSSRTSVPEDLASIKGTRYQSALADWQVSPWSDLRFSMPQPQHFAYSFESMGSGASAEASAIAQGDLDADGALSTYRLRIKADEKLNAVVAPEIETEDPYE